MNKQKATSLVKMAEVTLERLRETDWSKYPTNTLTDYYDVIHKLMDALATIEGVKFKGDGAHKELINYICKKYGLGESTKVFLQDLREFRNRITYEGFFITNYYISANMAKIESIIKNLFALTRQNE